VPLLQGVPSPHDHGELIDEVRGQGFLVRISLLGHLSRGSRYTHAQVFLYRLEVFVVVSEDVDEEFFGECDFSHSARRAPPITGGDLTQGSNLTSDHDVVNAIATAGHRATPALSMDYLDG